MLRLKVLPDILAQAKSSGVIGSMILTNEGDVVASSESGSEPQLVGAIAANIFGTYQRAGKSSRKGEDLDTMIVTCTEGLVLVGSMGRFLLCIYGEHDAEVGLLKGKLDALRSALEGPLSEVAKSGQ